MKTLLSFFFYALILAIVCCQTPRTDSVTAATERNNAKADEKIVDNDVANFLVKITDARRMDIQEGIDAVEKSSVPSIRNYGKLMIKDQNILLSKIKQLATKRKITLPDSIGSDKKEGLQDQRKKTGKDFDKKFIKMMIIDHERDIRDFKKASELNDRDVQVFASTYLPMIQSHLDKLKEIKKQLN